MILWAPSLALSKRDLNCMSSLLAAQELSCVICMMEYTTGGEQSNRQPSVLNCGHTFCVVCVKDPTLGVGKPCPVCRTPRTCVIAPRNFTLEDLIASSRAAKQALREQLSRKEMEQYALQNRVASQQSELTSLRSAAAYRGGEQHLGSLSSSTLSKMVSDLTATVEG